MACKEYHRAHLHGRFPNYIRLFGARSRHDRAMIAISAQLESIVKQLSNSRSQELLNKLNAYPVVSVGAHVAPFPKQWMNIASGIVLPVGVLLYIRAAFFRRRLAGDMKQIIKTNKEIQYIIYERKL